VSVEAIIFLITSIGCLFRRGRILLCFSKSISGADFLFFEDQGSSLKYSILEILYGCRPCAKNFSSALAGSSFCLRAPCDPSGGTKDCPGFPVLLITETFVEWMTVLPNRDFDIGILVIWKTRKSKFVLWVEATDIIRKGWEHGGWCDPQVDRETTFSRFLSRALPGGRNEKHRDIIPDFKITIGSLWKESASSKSLAVDWSMWQ